VRKGKVLERDGILGRKELSWIKHREANKYETGNEFSRGGADRGKGPGNQNQGKSGITRGVKRRDKKIRGT